MQDLHLYKLDILQFMYLTKHQELQSASMDSQLERVYLKLEATGHVVLLLSVLYLLYYVSGILPPAPMALTTCRQLLSSSSTHFLVYQVSYPCLHSNRL